MRWLCPTIQEALFSPLRGLKPTAEHDEAGSRRLGGEPNGNFPERFHPAFNLGGGHVTVDYLVKAANAAPTGCVDCFVARLVNTCGRSRCAACPGAHRAIGGEHTESDDHESRRDTGVARRSLRLVSELSEV